MSVFIIAEIGGNHNGDIEIAKKLIDGAALSGCNAVKFQKRTPELAIPEEMKSVVRETPWGNMTYLDFKKKVEFNEDEYDEIDRYCNQKGIEWFASAWDIESQEFLKKYKSKYNKVASAMLTNTELIDMIAAECKYTFISTGMSTYEEIDNAVNIFKKRKCGFELLHCNSAYPMKDNEANLKLIPVLRDMYKCKVGYSGHEVGLIISCGAVVLGATTIERHITLDRAMYGTDQAASVEVAGFERLVKYIRTLELAMGDGKKTISESELAMRKKLRK
jgi:N-acetylneuraminate synthase